MSEDSSPWYTDQEMRRVYAAEGLVMLFGGGNAMTAQAAAKLAPGLLVKEMSTGLYRRIQRFPSDELQAILAAPSRACPTSRRVVVTAQGSPWSPSR